MNQSARVILLLASGAAVSFALLSCTRTPPPALVLAPPGPADLGPATSLSTPPPQAAVFELSYRVQTGSADDIQYHSYWGFGGSSEEARKSPFIREVQKRASRLYYAQNPSLRGREWTAVEYDRRQPLALYFDVNADGKLSENERIPPTRKTDYGLEFITPDFSNSLEAGGEVLCRAVLQVNFYPGNSEPNCMWSQGAHLEGSATIDGKRKRLLLYANRPGGQYEAFGSSDFSLLDAGEELQAGQYIPRETLSSLVCSEGHYYRLAIEGRRSNGLPARVLLTRDTSPTGTLDAKLTGSNALQAPLSSLYLHGVDDKTVFFRVDTAKGNAISLPEGSYAMVSGTASYGSGKNPDWEVSFTGGPSGTVKAGQTLELAIGQPVLTVRAVEERQRYNRDQAGSTTFAKGMRIYLEPKITGKGTEVFGRFRQAPDGRGDKADRPPKVTITGPDGKQLLSQTMEYG